MFHFNGWCFPWTIAVRAGVNIWLCKVDPEVIVDVVREHGVTGCCSAPIVHNLLITAPAEMKVGLPGGEKAMVAGALRRRT
jgi:fatty-acyl-CoA synthase